MGMTLDAAGQIIDTNPAAARALLIEARDASVKALAELRDLVAAFTRPVLSRTAAWPTRSGLLILDSPMRIRRGQSTMAPTCSPPWPADAPDVAIVDVRLPPTFTDEGIRAALAARREVPGLPVLVLSQYVEQLLRPRAAGERQRGHRVPAQGPGVRQRAQFVDAVRRVAAGGTAMDPEVIARLLARNNGDGGLAALSPREREVLALMAEGRSNAAIAQRLVITERAVAKHTASIFTKLDLQPSDDDNRRVLAVLAYLGG